MGDNLLRANNQLSQRKPHMPDQFESPKIDDTEQRGTLAAALTARNKHAIGCVQVPWPRYSFGDFVFLVDAGKCWWVSMPMTASQLKKQRSVGSPIVECMATRDVPKSMVRLVLGHGY